MDVAEKDLMDFIMEQSQKEVSYEEQLERRKTLLLAQKEVEHWKRLVYETERFHEQYLREDRIDLQQVFKMRTMFDRLNEPRLKIVIDQGLERWVNEDDDAQNNYEAEINTLRSRIDRMKRQTERYKDVFEKVQESNSYQMVQESARKVREEEAKLEECQKAIDGLWKESYAQERKEWDSTKLLIVEFSQLCNESHLMNLEKETVLQNNEIKRVKIVQLHEEIERAKIEQEEEAKRREIELSERILIPIKITPMTLENTMFKNPNDFPGLVDKIESARKSYEQIFKRPEYMNLRKYRKKTKKDRSKCSVNFDLLFGLKRKSKTRKIQSSPAVTANEMTKSVTTVEAATDPKKSQPKVVVEKIPSIRSVPKLDQQFNAPVECHIPKSSPQSDGNRKPTLVSNEEVPRKGVPVSKKRKASHEATEEQQRPVCNVQGQRVKQRSTHSTSQPEPPAKGRGDIVPQPPKKRLSLDTPMSASAPPRKRPSLDTPISASAPPPAQEDREFKKPQLVQLQSPERPSRKCKPKKVGFKSQPQQSELEGDSFSFSPEKQDTKKKPQSKVASQPQPEQFEPEKDGFSFSPEKPDPKKKPKSKVADQSQPELFELQKDSFSFSSEKPDPKKKSKSNGASKSQPKPSELGKDNFSLSPEKPQQLSMQPQTHLPSSPTPPQTAQQPRTDPMDFEPQEHEQPVEDDSFSFGSASPPRQSKDGGSFFDSGSISSFDMEDRKSGSDLGFDLSPVGPRASQGEACGSDGNTSDFDFLASPPNSGAPRGSQGGGNKKGQDSFSFTDDEDSGTGFDFF